MVQILAKKFEIADVSSLEKTFEWYAHRIAGENEELYKKLVDKPFLEQRLSVLKTASALAAELGLVRSTFIQYLSKELGVDVYRACGKRKLVELTCHNPKCDKPGGKFFRPERLHKRDLQRNPNKPNYCSSKCFGQVQGATVGFAAHPENTRVRNQKKKK
jgi:hypothetical protein